MYNVLPQKYNYQKGISLSFVINIIVIILILHTQGTFFSNFSQNKKKTHTVSIHKYKIIHKTAAKSSSIENNPINQKQEIKKLEPQPIQKPIAKSPKKPNPSQNQLPKEFHKQEKPLEKQLEKNLERSTEASKVLEKTSTPQEVISKEITQEKQHETSDQIQDIQPAIEASHFGFNNEPPLYPIISFQLGESGDVTIEYIVSKDGNIIFTEVVKSSGHLRLDRVAVIEFKRWKFSPAKNLMGEPIDSGKKTITFSFDIKNRGISVQ